MTNRYRFGLNSARRYRITGPRNWPLWADYERTRQATGHGVASQEPVPPTPEPMPKSSPRQHRDDPPQTPPFDQTNGLADSVNAPISAVPTSAMVSGKSPTEPPDTGNTGDKLPGQSPASNLPLRQRVELWLRHDGIPYVNVDDAKKALFAGAKLQSFHFVAYRPQGPHWLIWAGTITPETRPDMLQWEQIFGDGFKAVLARRSRSNPLGFATKTLADELINW